MFSLSVADHVRLDSEQSARNYTIHAAAAERLARAAMITRIGVASLLALTTAIAIAAVLFETRPLQIATLVVSAVAFLAFAAYMVVGVEGRVYAHRAFAHRLWMLAERYRSLVAEMEEGSLDRDSLLRRRDELIALAHEVYEYGFGADQAGNEAARLTTPSRERAA